MPLIRLAQNVDYLQKIGVPPEAAPDLLVYLRSLLKDEVKWFLPEIKKHPGLALEDYLAMFRDMRERFEAAYDPAIKEWAMGLNREYWKWLANLAINKLIRMGQDDEKMKTLLNLFDLAKKRKFLPEEQRDITKFKSDKDLFNVLRPFLMQGKSDEIIIPDDEPGLVYNQNGIQILEVFDKNLAAGFASGTHWCVKDPEVGQDLYLKNGPLYFVFVDYRKSVLIHIPSRQIKETNDAPLKTYSIIKRIHPVLKELKLLKDEDDFHAYSEVLKEGQRVNADVRLALSRRNGNPAIALETKYPNQYDLQRALLFLEDAYLDDPRIQELCGKVFGKNLSSEYQGAFLDTYKELPRKIQLMPHILQICTDRFIKLIEKQPEVYTECSNDLKKLAVIQKARFTGFVHRVYEAPESFDDECPEEFRTEKEMIAARFEGWQNIIHENPLRYEDCPKDLRKLPELKKSQFEGWMREISRDPAKYNECPRDVQHNEEVKWQTWESCINQIQINPRQYDFCPEEFREMGPIQELAIRRWIEMIAINPLIIKHCPEEFKELPIVQSAYEDAMAGKIREHGEEDERVGEIPAEFVNSEKISNARVESWVKRINDRLEDYQIVPPDLKNNPAIQDAALQGWVNRIGTNPFQINFCPQEFKKNPAIRQKLYERNPHMRGKKAESLNWYRIAQSAESLV
jgi:hypothetical protein